MTIATLKKECLLIRVLFAAAAFIRLHGFGKSGLVMCDGDGVWWVEILLVYNLMEFINHYQLAEWLSRWIDPCTGNIFTFPV